MDAPPPVMKAEQILGLLPHRYPFLLIDRVLEVYREPTADPSSPSG